MAATAIRQERRRAAVRDARIAQLYQGTNGIRR
jgi:hypothetical protein